MSGLMKGCQDPKSSRNVPVRASWHLMSPASLSTLLTLAQLWLCNWWWQSQLAQQGLRNLSGRITCPTSPCSWSQSQGMCCTTLFTWSLSHTSAESDPHEGCKGRPSSDCSKACFRDGCQWKRQTVRHKCGVPAQIVPHKLTTGNDLDNLPAEQMLLPQYHGQIWCVTTKPQIYPFGQQN